MFTTGHSENEPSGSENRLKTVSDSTPMKAERWPDFVVIGAGKSGTTALNEYLDQHPGLFMAIKKEPNFFGLENVDIDSYDIEESRQYHLESVYKKDEYLALYDGAREDQITGEISNLYLYSDEAYLNIKKYIPNTKLIALIRQPADRLFSRYLHLLRDDKLPEDSWDQLFDKDTIWWKRPDLVHEGFYFKHLSKYYEHFPKENIKVFIYDDFRADPMKVLNEMFEFIGVEKNVEIDTDLVVNKSGKRKQNIFNYLLGSNGLLVETTRAIMPGIHKRMSRNKDVIKYLNKARNRNIISLKMNKALRKKITNEIYREDIQNLQQLLGRDLSHWLD